MLADEGTADLGQRLRYHFALRVMRTSTCDDASGPMGITAGHRAGAARAARPVLGPPPPRRSSNGACSDHPASRRHQDMRSRARAVRQRAALRARNALDGETCSAILLRIAAA
jgi:hypothetical protein